MEKERRADDKPAKGVKPSAKADSSFPIIGIGASAGGLEALEQFLGGVPERSGMAFIVIQHLDPTHKGVMPELLQRFTSMSVAEVRDTMKVEPGLVYVIPPNKEMSILKGKLHLLEPVEPRGMRHPIDIFFRSLAEDRQEWGVGVILSGMGSDGTLGLKAIKEKGGLSLAQDPMSAKFDGMPRSAIEAGLADIVAPAGELPAKIAAYFKKTPVHSGFEPLSEVRTRSGLDKALILLRNHTGYDFTVYKKSTIYRRIERRMGIHQIDRLADYIRYMQENSQEVELLFKELLIGVTSFFRDPAAWEYLKDEVIPAYLEKHPGARELRAWVPGCSTGEEAYSLAMVFKELLDERRISGPMSLQIFATDLDEDAIQQARIGFFPPIISTDVSPERLKRFFITDNGGYRVVKDIRDTVVFARQNIITDPPFTKQDLLVCRNLLIYLEPEIQQRLLPLFHYALNPGGTLFLGTAETVGGSTELFRPIESRLRIYRRLDSFKREQPLVFGTSNARSPEEIVTPRIGKSASLQTLADDVLLQRFSPAAVLVNPGGDILYISGKTGKYLEPAAGKANWNVMAMAREGLRMPLTACLQRVVRKGGNAAQHGIRVSINGGEQEVDLAVHAIEEPEQLRGTIMMTFRDASPEIKPSRKTRKTEKPEDGGLTVLHRELKEAREELQSLREEMQTSQEELKSTNEELQSSNEELQSTNEELTTSREEMQSMNEELQTLNAELQSRVNELTNANNDMKNLLDSTEIATVFLDDDFRLVRFTPPVTKVIKLIESDVGRPLSDVVTNLDYAELFADAEEVKRTLAFSEKEISSSDGCWFRVRIMPYRTIENRINGVVITFAEITKAKQLEEELRGVNERQRFLIETMSQGIIYFDEKGTAVLANAAADRIIGIPHEGIVGKPAISPEGSVVRDDGSPFPVDDLPHMMALRTGRPVRGVIMGLASTGGGATRWVLVDAVSEDNPDASRKYHGYLVLTDITELRKSR